MARQDADITNAPEMIDDLPEAALLLTHRGYDPHALREMVANRKAWLTRLMPRRENTQNFSACLTLQTNARAVNAKPWVSPCAYPVQDCWAGLACCRLQNRNLCPPGCQGCSCLALRSSPGRDRV